MSGLYAESIEFVRELVNNAYDADAALVEVILTDDIIEIRDNGSGMDMEGLKQYFNIGSQHKLSSPKSPLYNRDRIGMFGIGKLASLSACKRFEVITKGDDFVGRVTFDTDGRANQSMSNMPTDEEVMRIAGLLREQSGIDVIVVDTEEKGRFTTTDRASSVAALLNADYYTIDDLKSEYLHDRVQLKKQ